MKNKTHNCEKCGHNFTLAWNLKQHLKHSKACGTSKEVFQCDNCKKKFTLKATLTHHFARCIAVDPHRFACAFCERKFTFVSSLRKHVRSRCPQAPPHVNVRRTSHGKIVENVDMQYLEEPIKLEEIELYDIDEPDELIIEEELIM